MKPGDLVKFVDGTIIGLVVGGGLFSVQVLWQRANTPYLAKIRNLEVISEGR